jgi:putative glutamine amidotransferase
MTKKPPSARSKAKAAKEKREKAGMTEASSAIDAITDETRARLEESYDRTWVRNDSGKIVEGNMSDTGWIERSYPSEDKYRPTRTESDFLTAEEAQAAEEQMLGKRGVPELNDNVPDFLHVAAKAGPPKTLLDHLGRTPEERKERKIKDAIALGERRLHEEENKLPVIYAGKQDGPPKRVTTIMRDHDLEFPDLYLAVYVAGDWAVKNDEAMFARMFSRSGCYRANNLEEADLLVFGGGSDIEPALYREDNDEKHPQVFFDVDRDNADMGLYLTAREYGMPMFGVCRGAQLLHVMNEGKLFQHVDEHYGAHRCFAHEEKMMLDNVSSVHHQMVIHNKEMEVLLSTSQSKTRWLNKDVKETKASRDIEAFYYRDTGCFGVQGHPEYSGCPAFTVWCLKKINDLFLQSPEFTWEENKRLRMTTTARDAAKIAEQYVENAYNQSQEV